MRGESRVEVSEHSEKTEPFSQAEMDVRLRSIRVEEEIASSMSSSIPLDDLLVPPEKQGIRILMRPLTRSRSVSPGNHDNCEWLALHAEVAAEDQSQHKVLAVTQTPRDIKFSVRLPTDNEYLRPTLWSELYYDPASDDQILLNRSDMPITLSRESLQTVASPGAEYTINPCASKNLTPGTWRIKVYGTGLLDFRILEKTPARLTLGPSEAAAWSQLSDAATTWGKRTFEGDGNESNTTAKKRKATDTKDGDGVIMFLRSDPRVFPLRGACESKALGTTDGHALLELDKGETAAMTGCCEVENYTVTKREPIASTSLSTVYTANHSSMPDGPITVKVLKTRAPPSSAGRGPDKERNVIRQADIWLREVQSQEGLQHEGIVRLYGGDARYLSLYMEHVDARDLAAKGVWRAADTELFTGDRADARRILSDLAGALHYIHERGLVHNDIKPANVLYSRARGAVLCDFGLSTGGHHAPSTGGTPYYVPPEFIGRKLRGAPSDVWALGVTMLYVLGRVGLPDARGARNHACRLYWYIADLNRPPGHGRGAATGPSAIAQMHQWLSELSEARARLDRADRLERPVHEMLTPQPGQRITMAAMADLLAADTGAKGK